MSCGMVYTPFLCLIEPVRNTRINSPAKKNVIPSNNFKGRLLLTRYEALVISAEPTVRNNKMSEILRQVGNPVK